ncbi:MAG: hypothetical protein AAF989_11215 [Planctomycetota bacterium]
MKITPHSRSATLRTKFLTHSTRMFALLTVTTLIAGDAAADWHTFWHSVHVDYARNRVWPEPFTEVATAQTVAPFQVMTQNGWRAHNTIGNDLFRRGDGALLAAGRERVRWIASQAPQNRRIVYVLRGHNREETESRVGAVREAVSKMYLDGAGPEIYVTNIEPASAPGAWAEKVNRDRLSQMPAPVLPGTSAAGTAGAATASTGSP